MCVGRIFFPFFTDPRSTRHKLCQSLSKFVEVLKFESFNDKLRDVCKDQSRQLKMCEMSKIDSY